MQCSNYKQHGHDEIRRAQIDALSDKVTDEKKEKGVEVIKKIFLRKKILIRM